MLGAPRWAGMFVPTAVILAVSEDL